jgi:BASS family bile acid:Na+ symporter
VAEATVVITVIKASIALPVFGVGLQATAADATSLLRQPARLARATVAMIIIMPIVAILLSLTLGLIPAVTIALGALAICPVPPIWPRRALKAGGQQAFAIGLQVSMSLLTIFTIPLAMIVYGAVFGQSLHMAPSAVAKVALQTILLPLAVGIGVRRLAPELAARVNRPIMMLATLLLVAGAIPLLVKLFPVFGQLVGNRTLLAMTLFIVIGLLVGHVLGGPTLEDRATLALATSARHPAIAIAIAAANFPNQRLAPAAIALYLVLSAVVSLPYLVWERKRRAAAPRVEPRPGDRPRAA